MATIRLVLLAAALLAIQPACAAVGAWGMGQRAQMRLSAAGVDSAGRLRAALEIVLPSGSETYWRSPGDAGVAPEFDFSASSNLGAATVAFPPPVRQDDGYAITNIYRDRVTLLVDAAVADRSKPVAVHLTMHLGVCDKICVPDDVSASLALKPGDADDGAAPIVAAAAAALPGAAEPGTFALDAVARDGGTDGRPVFRVTGTVPEAASAELFVEGPAGWAPYLPQYVGEESGKAVYQVKFSRLGSDVPVAGAELRFTVRAAGRAIEQTLRLP